MINYIKNMTKIRNENDDFQEVLLNCNQIMCKVIVDKIKKKKVKQKFLIQGKKSSKNNDEIQY